MAVRKAPDVHLLQTPEDAKPPIPVRHGRPHVVQCIGRFLSLAALFAGLVAAAVILTVPGAAAAAEDCSDVEVIFARGTFEPPGIGAMGQGFTDALRARLPDRSVNVHAVNYLASLDFPRAVDGVVDVVNRVRSTAEGCPGTDIILGGYSQGAAVAAYATNDGLPAGYAPPFPMPTPLAGPVTDRVSAVVLFGRPSDFVTRLAVKDAPPKAVGPAYRSRTLDLCAARDPICMPGGLDRTAHSAYVDNGMASQAADFAAQRVRGQ